MPSLRALVRPTDWETIRSQTLKYKGLLQEEGAYKTFQNWHLRPGGQFQKVSSPLALRFCVLRFLGKHDDIEFEEGPVHGLIDLLHSLKSDPRLGPLWPLPQHHLNFQSDGPRIMLVL